MRLLADGGRQAMPLLLEAEERGKRSFQAQRERIGHLKIDRFHTEEPFDHPTIEHCLGRLGPSEAA